MKLPGTIRDTNANTTAGGARIGAETAVVQEGNHVIGGCACAVDDAHLGGNHSSRFLFDEVAKERIVGAAEDDDVDVRFRERGEVTLHRQAWDVAFEPPFFGEGDKERRRRTDGFDARRLCSDCAGIGAGRNCAGGRQNTNAPRSCGGHRGAGAGVDHTEDRHVEGGSNVVGRDGADRVACDDDRLYAAGYEMSRTPQGVPNDGLRPLCPIGHARGIAQINNVFIRECSP